MSGNRVFTVVVCGVPTVAVMLAAAPVVLVRAKMAGVATPAANAGRLYDPEIELAVNTAAVATPAESVVAVFTLPANVPLAPVCAGGVKVTTFPTIELLKAAVTRALKFVAKTVPTCALCGVPAVEIILETGPGMLVMENSAEVAGPDAAAVTRYDPASVSAVKAGATAMPLVFVVTIAVLLPPNFPLAPAGGAVNVT